MKPHPWSWFLGLLLSACGSHPMPARPPVASEVKAKEEQVVVATVEEKPPVAKPESRIDRAKSIVELLEQRPVVVTTVANAVEGNARMSAANGPRALVVWTDESRTSQSTEELVHVVTPLGDGMPGRFEHILVRAPREDNVGARLANVGLWPSAPGLETLRINDDGSRDVRAIGYLQPYTDHPVDRMYRPSRHLSSVTMSSAEASLDLGSRLSTEAKRGRGRLIGPLRSMSEEHRAQTMVTAVGTCSDTTVTGVAIVVSGVARAQNGSLAISVTKVETAVHVDKWLAMAPRYARLLREAASSIRRRGSPAPSDAGPLRAFRAELAKSFGTAVSLFEIDAVLSGLIEGLANGSKETALDALRLRCRAIEEETNLAHALGDDHYVDVR